MKMQIHLILYLDPFLEREMFLNRHFATTYSDLDFIHLKKKSI
jgi:hypothetical protein